MSDLLAAEKAVKEQRARVLGYLQRSGLSTARATANLDLLIAAVRHHDAETARDFAEQEDGHLLNTAATAYVQGIRDAADRINPEETP